MCRAALFRFALTVKSDGFFRMKQKELLVPVASRICSCTMVELLTAGGLFFGCSSWNEFIPWLTKTVNPVV